MDYRFKVEIEIDAEKVVSEDKYDLNDMYAAIIRIFQENDIFRIRTDSDRTLAFATKKHSKFSKILVAVNNVYLSEIQPYLKSAVWHNNETGETEDILQTFRNEGV